MTFSAHGIGYRRLSLAACPDKHEFSVRPFLWFTVLDGSLNSPSIIGCSGAAASFSIAVGDISRGDSRGPLDLGLLQRIRGSGPRDRISRISYGQGQCLVRQVCMISVGVVRKY